MNFKNLFNQYSWEEVSTDIYAKTAKDVAFALTKDRRNIEDFKALISPAAEGYIEEMAQISQGITQKRFGRTVQMYVPMYLSNECQNICTYCGFSFGNKIPRLTLSDAQILEEVKVIKEMGFDHILLVTGEASQKVGVEYLRHAIKLVRPYFSNISIEVQPLAQNEYKELIKEGLYAVMVYQETYHKSLYIEVHPKGNKSNFENRLSVPDKLGKVGIDKIGLGALLGLTDWRVDSFFTALHLSYLEKRYWKTKYSISFPRLRPFEGKYENVIDMSDKQLLQLICAYRLLNDEVELSLSTRESATFRDNVFSLGITSMSAASKTNPGGYASGDETLEQFEISDNRTALEMKKMIQARSYEVVWKDWDKVYDTANTSF